MEMTLKNVLADVLAVGNDGFQKNASDQSGAGVSEKTSAPLAVQQELIDALHKVVDTEKVAGSPAAIGDTPAVDSLVKMASNLAETEQQALVKEAHLYGAAVADGFVARLNQYDQSLDAAGVKTAEAGGFVPSEEEFVKFANANPQAVQQAMDQGYANTTSQIDQVKTAAANEAELEKIASTPGGQAEIAELEKLAATEEGQAKLAGVRQGFTDSVNDIMKLAQTEDGMQKLADIQTGYNNTMDEVEKIATDCFGRGFEDTIRMVETNI
jgi:hypothetical protein